MEYYFADRKSNILGVGSTDGKGEWRIDNDIETQSVDNRPAVELSLDIHFTNDQEQAVNEMAKATNFIMYQDEEGNAHQMVIESVDHDSLGHIHSIVASDAGNDLINETVGAYKADKPYTIADYITRFTNDSGWEIGINEFPKNVRTLEWTSEESSLARIIAVAKDFDAVLSFGFEFVGTNLVKRVINIRHETAGDSLISFEMNKDINNIVTHLDTYDMETSIKAYGAVLESTDGSTNQDPINLIGYSWTDPTGQFVLDQYGFLHDTIAVQKYSRLLSNSNPNPTQSDWNRVKTFDSKSQAALLQAALADLKKYNHPNETYDIDLVNSPYVPLNQTVHIADENQQLFLSAKVLSIQRSRANHSVQLTLGEFAHETVSFDERLSELANQMSNISKTVQYYPWLRYADDDKGTNMSAFPTGKKYMAIVWSNKSSVPSDNPADYAGHWALIQGKDGADGVPGEKGADGRTSYFHTAWANDVSGQSGFTVSGGDGKKYIGTYSDFTKADSTNPSDYNWALFKGADGKEGVPGKPGADGKTPYFHIAYADSSDGRTNFSLDTPGSRKYIGSYTDFMQADSNNPALYSWQLVQGPQGPQGPQGVPGSKDVPYPYVQLDAPANPKKGDTWWHGTSLKDATAVQRYDGSKWVDDAIAQAVLYIKELNSIILNSAEINSPNINVPFQHVRISGSEILSSGSLTLHGASYVISGNIEDNSGKPNGQIYHTEVNPDGLMSYITQTDGKTQMHTSRISMGVLELTDLVSGLGNSAKYITSTFNAHDAVDYYHKDSGLETNDVKNLNISYSRKGPNVTIGIAFNMKTGNGWVKIANIRPGYSPFNSDDAARLLGSMSFTGAACELYVSAGGIYIIPWRGQGGYAGSLSFITHDAYPTNDAVVN
ncbi:phage tail assembly [Lacticaseibacillus paracasei]|uniref:phage tail protein n=1 Tax=Lacticaseibacillus paracasei TaxID=1597 RepID=UPI0006805C4C|nr:phage tail protein [Lacticaseibacillus paracasei]AKU35406.1 phage tail assembly [Lacticaseibacillus paracasei]